MKRPAFRTLDKRWLLSFTSLPLGETRVREQVAENRFFRNLLVKPATTLENRPMQIRDFDDFWSEGN